MWVIALVGLASAEEYVPDWPLTTRWAETPRGYFSDAPADLLLAELGGDAALDAMRYEVADQTALLYVPDGYQPGAGWGVFVQIEAVPRAELAPGWRDVLAAEKLIYVSAHGVGNSQDVALRIAWSLDALASVEAGYDVDPDRFVVGGFSGGGAVATMVGAHFPDVFVGTVDQCRAVMWEEHEIATIPGAAFGMGEVDHLDPDGLEHLAGGHRFAFVTGDRDVLTGGQGDFANYEGILDGIGDWWERDLRARVWDVPGQFHAKPDGEAFGAALGWVLDCRDDGLYPPRFETDHLPPHTPFPTPDAEAPDACDPVVAPPVREADMGCGCASGGGGSGGGLGLVAALGALARRSRRQAGWLPLVLATLATLGAACGVDGPPAEPPGPSYQPEPPNTAGVLDDTFGDAGVVQWDWFPGFGMAVDIAVDGRVRVSGYGLDGPDEVGVVFGLLPDGSADAGWGDGGVALLPEFDTIERARLDQDGLVVAGRSGGDVVVARLDGLGRFDPGFGTGGLVVIDRLAEDSVVDLEPDPQGGWLVLIGSKSGLDDGVESTALVRLGVDGALDATFGQGGSWLVLADRGLALFGGSVVAGPNGHRLVVHDTSGGATLHACSALGVPEPGPVTLAFADPVERFGVALGQGDRVLLGGYHEVESFYYTNLDVALASILLDGTPDSTFGVDGGTRFDTMVSEVPNDLAVDDSGRVVMVGSRFLSYEGFGVLVARVGPDGVMDPTFGRSGVSSAFALGGLPSRAQAVAVQDDGAIVLAGYVDNGTEYLPVAARITGF